MRRVNSIRSIVVRGILVVCLLGIGSAGSTFAQTPGAQLPNLTITFDAQIIDTDVFYLSDAALNLQDLFITRQGPVLFTINIASDEATDVLFGFEIVADTEVGQGEIQIFSGITQPVRLEANQPRYFTSRDFGTGGSLELYQYETIDLNTSEPGAKQIVDVVRASGRLPDGIYSFYLTTYVPGSTVEPYLPLEEVRQVVRHLRIVNPTQVDLLSPMDGDRLVTQFPLFQWRSDTREVILRVFERRPTMRSREEAITGIPHLEQRLQHTNQFFYPQTGAGVRALEPGKQYVWYLEAVYRTSANVEETIVSELQEFSIIDPSRESAGNIILMQLEQLLEGEYDHIVRQIEEEGFEVGEEFFLDGVRITIAELQMLINAIRAGENNAAVVNATIE
jgi:hypothetical protein